LAVPLTGWLPRLASRHSPSPGRLRCRRATCGPENNVPLWFCTSPASRVSKTRTSRATMSSKRKKDYGVSAKEFVIAWTESISTAEVAARVGMPRSIVSSRAAQYRRKGVRLKKFTRRGRRPLAVDRSTISSPLSPPDNPIATTSRRRSVSPDGVIPPFHASRRSSQGLAAHRISHFVPLSPARSLASISTSAENRARKGTGPTPRFLAHRA
jgi:hypothetical protein